MPANIVVAMRPMKTSVAAALRLLGSSKPGTPLETASTPVSAVQPEANARSTRNTVSRPPVSATPCSSYCALSAVMPEPKATLAKPTASMR